MMQSIFVSRRSLSSALGTNSSNQTRLEEIVSLLEDKRESLAACRSRLSLTTRQIQDICTALYSSSLHSTSDSSSLHNLLDNVKAIKITPNSANLVSSPSEIVNLSPFHQLTYLDIRSIDISHVIHLSQLRSQLHHLVLSACVDSLNEVLQECGGDKCTDSFLWSELHSLHVTCCQGIDLGTGLQLAPWLKTLNLTFNELTDNAIQSLSTLLTLHSLTLDFNNLQRIPVLAPSARTSLKVLHLRQNQLESLNGLEQLHSLEELDVAYNCISNVEALSALSFLTHLIKLNLEFNPLSYVKDYRQVVMRRVSITVNKKKFLLDEQPLSVAEKEVVGTMAALYSGHQEFDDLRNLPRYSQQITVLVTDETNEENSIHQIPLPSGNEISSSCKKHNPSPIRTHNSASITPVTPSTISTAKRRKASRMREVEILDTGLQQNNAFLTPEWLGTAPPEGENSSTGHLTTKQRVEELRRTFGQENWLSSQAGNEVRMLLGWQESATILHDKCINNVQPVAEVIGTTTEAIKDDAVVVLELDREQCTSEISTAINDSKEEESEESDDLHIFVVMRHFNSSQEERLLTITAAYLCEKDTLNGQTLQYWQRSKLQSVTILQESSPSCQFVKIQLSFSSSFRGNSEPIYSMELDDFTELEKTFTSCLNSSSASGEGYLTSKDVQDDLKCMKCDQTFPSFRAAVRLRTNVSSPLLKGHLEEYSVCPYCESDMVFAIEEHVCLNRTDVSSSDSISSSSNHSGSDVIVATNEPYSPTNVENGDKSETSEEGSVEVMDKGMRFSSMDFSTPNSNSTVSKGIKSVAKSLSSRSHSSKSSSQTSQKNTLTSCSARSFLVNSVFTFSYADFSQVDHRLRLYCEMFLLSHHTEEFHGLVKVELVTMNSSPVDEELTPIPALVVITSHKVYFLKITGFSSEQPEKWLTLEASYPLNQLNSIMTVIGNQGILLKFDSSSSLILLRDLKRTKNVTHFLTDMMEKTGLSVPLVKTDLMSDQWLALDELVRGDQDTASTCSVDGIQNTGRFRTDISSRVFLFCGVCRVEWGNERENQEQATSFNNAALMVTNDRLALIRGDPRWLMSPQIQFRKWGVALLSLQQLVNLVSLESFISKPEQIRCYFLDEASGMEEKWTVTLATREAVDQLIEAVRYPWEAIFSVELEINELDE